SLDQQRTSNAVNKITAIAQRYGAPWAQPSYDRAGNMTNIPRTNSPTTSFAGAYDAWNRLVSLDGAATYSYDGLNRRIGKIVSSTNRNFYYSLWWQVLEERIAGDSSPDRQFVWGLRYVDELVLRDRFSGGSLSDRFYAVQDANWNVTAITNTGGAIQER